MDYSSGSGVAATQTAVLYLPRGRCRCLRRCLYLVVKAAEAVGAETLAGSFARPIRRRSCGRGSWRNRRQGHLQTETAAGQLRRQWRPGHSPGRDGGGEVVGHWRRGSVLSWGGIDDRGGTAGRVLRAPVPG